MHIEERRVGVRNDIGSGYSTANRKKTLPEEHMN